MNAKEELIDNAVNAVMEKNYSYLEDDISRELIKQDITVAFDVFTQSMQTAFAIYGLTALSQSVEAWKINETNRADFHDGRQQAMTDFITLMKEL